MIAITSPRSAYETPGDPRILHETVLEPAAVAHRTPDDAVVVLGLAAAGLVSPSALEPIFEDGSVLDLTPDRLASLGVAATEFNRFQELWYRFKVPHARASLVWWRMFCAALGTGQDLLQATDRLTEWLDIPEDGGAETDLPRLAEWASLRAGGAVLTDAEFDDVPALYEAVRREVPLLADSNPVALAARLRAAGCAVLVRSSPGPVVPRSLAELCPGYADQLPGIVRRTRAAWQQLPDEERTALLVELSHRVSALEQVRQIVRDRTPLENRQIVEVLLACLAKPPAEWPSDHLSLTTLWWCWREAGFAIQELNQSVVSLPAIALFLTRRVAEYAGHADRPPAPSDTANLIELARLLGTLRQQIERRFLRCLQFDGSDWERREFLVPKASLEEHLPVPEDLRAHLQRELGVPYPTNSGSLEAWDRYLAAVLEAGQTPTRVLQALARWTANCPDLRVDYAIFTVPMGNKLEEPWTLDFDDVFCYTGFRAGFDPADFGVPLDLVGVQNAVGQRMRYNVVKKAQNYALVKRFPPQSFNLPDLSVAEDANHGGHQAAGIRLALRVPASITYRGRVWKGLADLRLNRAGYTPRNHFRPEDILVAHRYIWWARGIAEAAYRRDLTFAKRWCGKVTSLED